MALQLGDTAPDFEAETTEGRIKFHDWIGDSWAVLFSHPKDFTPVCTTELGYMASIEPEFAKRNTKVIGLSVDPLDKHEQWAADIKETQGTAPNYPIISDADFAVSKLYGMLPDTVSGDPADRTPADNQTVRNVFVIGPDKKVKLIFIYPMTTGRNFDEVLRVVDSLQLTAKHKVATPAQWKDGDDVIISGSVKADEAKELFPDGWDEPKPYIRIVPPAEQVVATYVGIDVGGRRKGFHACAVAGATAEAGTVAGPTAGDGTGGGGWILAGPERLGGVEAAVAWVAAREPAVVGLDSPKSCAPPGERSRADERALAREVCNIRWTPAASELAGNPYYEWVEHGLELYAALARALPGAELIEVFPTASWTVWSGPRDGRSRSAWSAAALAELDLAGLPARRLSQDDRDAVAAALTARLHGDGRARSFGEIVVPATRST